eukprot:scaffold3901_cov390-Prasinococcus_capsulatus_cf.AAC.4
MVAHQALSTVLEYLCAARNPLRLQAAPTAAAQHSAKGGAPSQEPLHHEIDGSPVPRYTLRSRSSRKAAICTHATASDESATAGPPPIRGAAHDMPGPLPAQHFSVRPGPGYVDTHLGASPVHCTE